MEENIKRYHPLGRKTLFMLILRKSFILLFLFIILIFGVGYLSYVPQQYLEITANAIMVYLVLFIIAVSLVFFVGWLEYIRYWIFVDDKDLKIARGLISTEQIGIPYRRVQDIKIKRSLVDQFFGVSDILITVLGSEEVAATEEEETIVLPALDREIALEIQNIVLRKAQVEQIHVVAGQRIN